MRFKWDWTTVRIREQTGFSCVFFLAELLLGAGEIALAMLDEALCVRPASLGHSDERKKHHAEGVIESYCNAATRVCLSDVWNGPDMFSPPHRGTVRKLLFSDAVVISVLFWGAIRGHSGIQEENIQRCLSLSVSAKINSYSCVFSGWSAAEKRTYEMLFPDSRLLCFSFFRSPRHVRQPPTMSWWVLPCACVSLCSTC